MKDKYEEADFCSLYRAYGSSGVLLYVGISCEIFARIRCHQTKSRWFNDLEHIYIEKFPNRYAALSAESKAIKEERPKFNIAGAWKEEIKPIEKPKYIQSGNGGVALKKYLEKNQITQREFSKKLGVSDGAITRWVKGERIPKMKLIMKIKKETNGEVNPQDFYL